MLPDLYLDQDAEPSSSFKTSSRKSFALIRHIYTALKPISYQSYEQSASYVNLSISLITYAALMVDKRYPSLREKFLHLVDTSFLTLFQNGEALPLDFLLHPDVYRSCQRSLHLRCCLITILYLLLLYLFISPFYLRKPPSFSNRQDSQATYAETFHYRQSPLKW